jgi:predicted porin
MALALVCCIASHPAQAQGDLTMYGNFDIGIKKRSDARANIGRGFNNWLGWRGSERLDGGMEAFFVTEMRFDPGTGREERAGRVMQGETTVGLRSATAGSLRLGRALSPLWQDIWKFEPWINSGENASLAAYQSGSYTSDGVHDADIDYADFSRFDHAVFYVSPVWHGWSAHVAGDMERDDASRRRPAGASFNHAAGGAGGQLAFERNANDDRILFGAVSRTVGKLKLMASAARIAPRQGRTERVAMVAATLEAGANTLRFGYGRNFLLGHDKLSTGVVHHLSPRTGLYADLYRERAASGVTGTALGIMHTF